MNNFTMSVVMTIFMIVIFSGCVRLEQDFDAIVDPNRMSVSEYEDASGSPHIDNGSQRYYLSGDTEGTLAIIEYDGDTITQYRHHRYDERSLYHYVPMLIQSLKHKDPDIADRALKFLTDLMRELWPNGYHEKYYRTENKFKHTPFEKYPPTWTENSYQEWLNWWKKHGRKDFDEMRIQQ